MCNSTRCYTVTRLTRMMLTLMTLRWIHRMFKEYTSGPDQHNVCGPVR